MPSSTSFPSQPVSARSGADSANGTVEHPRKTGGHSSPRVVAGEGVLAGLPVRQRTTLSNTVMEAHHQRRSTLDLRKFTPDDLNNMPSSAAALLDSHVENVRLPAGMATVPQWVTGMNNLKKLDVPGFQGDKVTLKSPHLAEVYVPPGTLVENRAWVDTKTRVNHIENGKVVGQGTAVGQIYQTQTDAVKRDVNLNCKVEFGDSSYRGRETIVCRHIATREALDAQKQDADKKLIRQTAPSAKISSRAQQREKQMGTPALMQQHIDQMMEARYHELRKDFTTEKIIASHDRWGELISDQFDAMKGPGSAHMIVGTGTHSMELSLKAKQMKGMPEGTLSYAVKFYDPNFSLDELRVVEADLEAIKKLKMGDFVRHPEYYGPAAAEMGVMPGYVTSFMKLPEGAYGKNGSLSSFEDCESLSEAGAPRHPVKYMVNESDRAAPVLPVFMALHDDSMENANNNEIRVADALVAGMRLQGPENRAEYLLGCINPLLSRDTEDLREGIKDVKNLLNEMSSSHKVNSRQLQQVLLGLNIQDEMPLAHSYGIPVELVHEYRGLIEAANLDVASRKKLGAELRKLSHDLKDGKWFPNQEFHRAHAENRETAKAYRDLMDDLMFGPARSRPRHAASPAAAPAQRRVQADASAPRGAAEAVSNAPNLARIR